MKIIKIFGYHEEENRALTHALMEELKKHDLSVGVIRQKDCEAFLKNSGGDYTDIDKILDLYVKDYMLLEGQNDINAPNLVIADSLDEATELVDDLTMLITGKVAEEYYSAEYKKHPIYHEVLQLDEIISFLMQYTPERMPNYTSDCCTACGTDCRGMTKRILEGTAAIDQCILKGGDVQLFIDDKAIPMVPFVKRLVRNVTTSVVKELDGYTDHSEIVVKIRQ